MEFYIPVHVYEGIGIVRARSRELAALGTKALLVTGKSSAKKNGSLRDVTEALSSEGVSFAVFSEVEENPAAETILKARDMGLAEGVDFVVGIGGGSALDASKLIALMIFHKDEGADFLFDKNADNRALPIAAVPTTCGTGSELTAVSILTLPEKRSKSSTPHRIFPAIALLDGTYLKSAPRQVLNNTAIDALGHMIESIINVKSSDFSRMTAMEGIREWRKSKDVLLGKRGATDEDYQNLIKASGLGGIAIAQTGTCLPHALSYPVTFELGMPHGRAIGYFEAAFLKASPKELSAMILDQAEFSSPEAFEDFYMEVCDNPVIPEDLLNRAVEMTLKNTDKLKAAPFLVNQDVLRKVAGLD